MELQTTPPQDGPGTVGVCMANFAWTDYRAGTQKFPCTNSYCNNTSEQPKNCQNTKEQGLISAVKNISGGDAVGLYTDLSATGGSGSGAKFKVDIVGATGSFSTSVSITSPAGSLTGHGTGYAVDDVLTIASADVGGGSAVTFKVASVMEGAVIGSAMCAPETDSTRHCDPVVTIHEVSGSDQNKVGNCGCVVTSWRYTMYGTTKKRLPATEDCCGDQFAKNTCVKLAPGDTKDVPDMWENYMDYGDGSCQVMFTKGQKYWMRAVLLSYRKGILCAAAGTTTTGSGATTTPGPPCFLCKNGKAVYRLEKPGTILGGTDPKKQPKSGWYNECEDKKGVSIYEDAFLYFDAGKNNWALTYDYKVPNNGIFGYAKPPIAGKNPSGPYEDAEGNEFNVMVGSCGTTTTGAPTCPDVTCVSDPLMPGAPSLVITPANMTTVPPQAFMTQPGTWQWMSDNNDFPAAWCDHSLPPTTENCNSCLTANNGRPAGHETWYQSKCYYVSDAALLNLPANIHQPPDTPGIGWTETPCCTTTTVMPTSPVPCLGNTESVEGKKNMIMVIYAHDWGGISQQDTLDLFLNGVALGKIPWGAKMRRHNAKSNKFNPNKNGAIFIGSTDTSLGFDQTYATVLPNGSTTSRTQTANGASGTCGSFGRPCPRYQWVHLSGRLQDQDVFYFDPSIVKAGKNFLTAKNVTKEFGVYTHGQEHDLSIYIYEKDDTTGLLKENCHVASLPIDIWKDDDWPKDWREDCNNMTDSKGGARDNEDCGAWLENNQKFNNLYNTTKPGKNNGISPCGGQPIVFEVEVSGGTTASNGDKVTLEFVPWGNSSTTTTTPAAGVTTLCPVLNKVDPMCEDRATQKFSVTAEYINDDFRTAANLADLIEKTMPSDYQLCVSKKGNVITIVGPHDGYGFDLNITFASTNSTTFHVGIPSRGNPYAWTYEKAVMKPAPGQYTKAGKPIKYVWKRAGSGTWPAQAPGLGHRWGPGSCPDNGDWRSHTMRGEKQVHATGKIENCGDGTQMCFNETPPGGRVHTQANKPAPNSTYWWHSKVQGYSGIFYVGQYFLKYDGSCQEESSGWVCCPTTVAPVLECIQCIGADGGEIGCINFNPKATYPEMVEKCNQQYPPNAPLTIDVNIPSLGAFNRAAACVAAKISDPTLTADCCGNACSTTTTTPAPTQWCYECKACFGKDSWFITLNYDPYSSIPSMTNALTECTAQVPANLPFTGGACNIKKYLGGPCGATTTLPPQTTLPPGQTTTTPAPPTTQRPCNPNIECCDAMSSAPACLQGGVMACIDSAVKAGRNAKIFCADTSNVKVGMILRINEGGNSQENVSVIDVTPKFVKVVNTVFDHDILECMTLWGHWFKMQGDRNKGAFCGGGSEWNNGPFGNSTPRPHLNPNAGALEGSGWLDFEVCQNDNGNIGPCHETVYLSNDMCVKPPMSFQEHIYAQWETKIDFDKLPYIAGTSSEYCAPDAGDTWSCPTTTTGGPTTTTSQPVERCIVCTNSCQEGWFIRRPYSAVFNQQKAIADCRDVWLKSLNNEAHDACMCDGQPFQGGGARETERTFFPNGGCFCPIDDDNGNNLVSAFDGQGANCDCVPTTPPPPATPPPPVSIGACCYRSVGVAETLCRIETQAGCHQISLLPGTISTVFSPNVNDCRLVNCWGAGTGLCCLPNDGGCVVNTEAQCAALNGEKWTAGVTTYTAETCKTICTDVNAGNCIECHACHNNIKWQITANITAAADPQMAKQLCDHVAPQGHMGNYTCNAVDCGVATTAPPPSECCVQCRQTKDPECKPTKPSVVTGACCIEDVNGDVTICKQTTQNECANEWVGVSWTAKVDCLEACDVLGDAWVNPNAACPDPLVNCEDCTLKVPKTWYISGNQIPKGGVTEVNGQCSITDLKLVEDACKAARNPVVTTSPTPWIIRPATTTPAPDWKLIWPVAEGHDNLMVQESAWTGKGDDYAGHQGIDMFFHQFAGLVTFNVLWQDMVNNPTPIYAAAAGEVIYVRDIMDDQCDRRQSLPNPHALGGALCNGPDAMGQWPSNKIIIDHGVAVQANSKPSYRYTIYGHLAKDSIPAKFKAENTTGTLVTPVTVQRGELIGYVGSSGACAGPHLHFQVTSTVDAAGGAGPGVDPFLSEWGGSNTVESLWVDQCGLPIYNTNTKSGSVPPKLSSCGAARTREEEIPLSAGFLSQVEVEGPEPVAGALASGVDSVMIVDKEKCRGVPAGLTTTTANPKHKKCVLVEGAPLDKHINSGEVINYNGVYYTADMNPYASYTKIDNSDHVIEHQNIGGKTPVWRFADQRTMFVWGSSERNTVDPIGSAEPGWGYENNPLTNQIKITANPSCAWVECDGCAAVTPRPTLTCGNGGVGAHNGINQVKMIGWLQSKSDASMCTEACVNGCYEIGFSSSGSTERAAHNNQCVYTLKRCGDSTIDTGAASGGCLVSDLHIYFSATNNRWELSESIEGCDPLQNPWANFSCQGWAKVSGVGGLLGAWQSETGGVTSDNGALSQSVLCMPVDAAVSCPDREYLGTPCDGGAEITFKDKYGPISCDGVSWEDANGQYNKLYDTIKLSSGQCLSSWTLNPNPTGAAGLPTVVGQWNHNCANVPNGECVIVTTTAAPTTTTGAPTGICCFVTNGSPGCAAGVTQAWCTTSYGAGTHWVQTNLDCTNWQATCATTTAAPTTTTSAATTTTSAATTTAAPTTTTSAATTTVGPTTTTTSGGCGAYGEWQSTEEYNLADIVCYNNSLWLCDDMAGCSGSCGNPTSPGCGWVSSP